ncbi:hypothetical protein SOVF_050960, partial [Spinacia oleracea]
MPFQIKTIENEQEDLQFLGFFSIFKESFKIILTWPKIFIQITLSLILPQSFLFLANNWISKLLLTKIHQNDTYKVASPPSHSVHSEWISYWLIKAVYVIFSMVLSLFIISAVVYIVACIYTGKDIAFKKVMSVVPKVWKQLMVTFLCNFCIMFTYLCILSLVIVLPIIFFYKPERGGRHLGTSQIGVLVIVLLISTLLILGFFYITMIWQLANVVSVMEKSCGFKALKKSKKLIKGKMGTSL